MQASTFRAAALAFLPSVATMLFVQACGGSAAALAQDAADPMEGVWENTVTQRDCTTQAALASFRGLQVYHRGGTLTDTGGGPTATRSAGFGVWTRSGDTVTTKFRFFRYNADGSPAGSSIVARTVTLGADNKSVTGASQVTVLDTAGNTVAQGCSTDTGTRFQ
ncbi:MAG: hypothetical protein ACJ8G7_10470 [Rhizobacter sp.]